MALILGGNESRKPQKSPHVVTNLARRLRVRVRVQVRVMVEEGADGNTKNGGITIATRLEYCVKQMK